VSIIRRTITSFLNRVGGIILIGVKEDVKTKSKIVLGE
jgi:predicted HTH transcriptional regulator